MFKKPRHKKGLTLKQKAAAKALAKKIKDERPERKHVYTLPQIRTWQFR